MRNSRLALVLLCLGLIGPLSTSAFSDPPVSTGAGEKIQQASQLAQSGKYADALKILDQLRGMRERTSEENTAMRELREYVVAQMQAHPAQ